MLQSYQGPCLRYYLVAKTMKSSLWFKRYQAVMLLRDEDRELHQFCSKNFPPSQCATGWRIRMQCFPALQPLQVHPSSVSMPLAPCRPLALGLAEFTDDALHSFLCILLFLWLQDYISIFNGFSIPSAHQRLTCDQVNPNLIQAPSSLCHTTCISEEFSSPTDISTSVHILLSK